MAKKAAHKKAATKKVGPGPGLSPKTKEALKKLTEGQPLWKPKRAPASRNGKTAVEGQAWERGEGFACEPDESKQSI